ncbi:MAG: hypothetical protein ACLTNS_01715 [Acutalibacteraceae bacterium]
MFSEEIILSAVTVLTAIIALWQTQRQIRLSNKQHLFDKRLEKYSLIDDLITLYKKNRNQLIDTEDSTKNDRTKECIIMACDYYFELLANVSYLADMIFAIRVPLDPTNQNVLLSKLEMLKKSAREISVLWKDDLGEEFSKFIYTYADLLFKLYQQKIRLVKAKDHESYSYLQYNSDKAQEDIKNFAEKNSLFETIKALDDIYKKIITEKRLAKLMKTLKLSC